MKPGMELLLALLRGEPIATQPSPEAWQLALDLAEHEGVLPSCVAAIRRAGAPLPEPVSVSLAAIDRELAISSFWWTSELSGILSAFHQGSSPLILLKGPLLAKRLYGDVHLRTSRDLDLLVRASDLRAARALLTKLGFMADLRPDDYHQSWRRGTTLLELHHNVENPLAYRLDMNFACGPDPWKLNFAATQFATSLLWTRSFTFVCMASGIASSASVMFSISCLPSKFSYPRQTPRTWRR